MSEKTEVVVVEDDCDIGTLLKFALEMDGQTEVFLCTSGTEGLAAIRSRRPHLVILDIMLPGISGLEILQQIRRDAILASTPVVLLSARGTEQDRVKGLEAGADDYVSKPFSPKELVLRTRALMRRSSLGEARHRQSARVVRLDALKIFLDDFQVTIGDEIIRLTVTEFKLLSYLVSNIGKLHTRDVLMDVILGTRDAEDSRAIDTHVKRLRAKLGDFGARIQTVYGMGYKIEAAVESSQM